MFDPAVYEALGIPHGQLDPPPAPGKGHPAIPPSIRMPIAGDSQAAEGPSIGLGGRTRPDASEAVSGAPVRGPVLAGLLGVDVRTITDLAVRGIVVRHGRGQFVLADSVTRYCQHLRTVAAGRTTAVSLTDERTRLVREQADAIEFKNAEARRELLPAKEVELEWASILRDLRASLLSIPSRVQQRLGTLSQADVSVLDREIRDVLTELGGDATD